MGPPVVVGLSVSSPGRVGEGLVEHRYREGRLMVPAGLEGIVLAVLGLDNRPQASPHFRLSKQAAAPSSYTPLQVAQAYQFPAGTDGTGQTIAILEFGGGFPASDLQSYCSGLGLPVLSVKAAGVDGASNAPGSDPSGADGEVLLDIEVAGSVAPGATQVVYFGPNTDQAFVDAIRRLGRAGRGGQRGPADRLPGAGRRQPGGHRRHQRRCAVVGRADRPTRAGHGAEVRAAAASSLQRRDPGHGRRRVQRHHCPSPQSLTQRRRPWLRGKGPGCMGASPLGHGHRDGDRGGEGKPG